MNTRVEIQVCGCVRRRSPQGDVTHLLTFSSLSMHPILSASTTDSNSHKGSCRKCKMPAELGFAFSYAFQPIVDIRAHQIYAHEALIRGPTGESAMSVLAQVTERNRYTFDQACRVKAIELAASYEMTSRLSINFFPNAIYRPEVCIRTTLAAASAHAFPIDRIIFETVEGERVTDGPWFAEVLREYQRIGFLTAIDDFGAGFAGLNLLADFQPDLVKLDMGLIRGIDQRQSAQRIVEHIVRLCASLGVRVIAEGIETAEEFRCLEALGIELMQGYLFARPQFKGRSDNSSIAWPLSAAADADNYPDDLFGSSVWPRRTP